MHTEEQRALVDDALEAAARGGKSR
jgi:hypothetical protein